MKLASGPPICAQRFQVSPRFLNDLCTPGVCTIATRNEKCDDVQLSGMTFWEAPRMHISEYASLMRHTYISYLF